MPNYDQTGPQGLGQGTGRRMGPCFNENAGRGFGIGRSNRRGMGFRNRGKGFGFFRSDLPDNEIEKSYQEEIDSLKSRIVDLENKLSEK